MESISSGLLKILLAKNLLIEAVFARTARLQ